MKLFLVLAITIMLSSAVLAQRQGITGKIEWLSGNQMPGPDRTPQQASGIKRKIWIYEPVTLQQTKADGVFFSEIDARLVKKINSKSDGTFCVKLPPGAYSIFVKEKTGLFANSFDGDGRISSVTVIPGEFAKIVIRVDYEAAY
jgi:hypothetical protein